jgi:hypothetical protein
MTGTAMLDVRIDGNGKIVRATGVFGSPRQVALAVGRISSVVSVLSQKFVEEFSPSADGGQNVVRQPTDRESRPSSPSPLPPSGRGVSVH